MTHPLAGIGHPLSRGGKTFLDPDAQDYFSRRESLGGAFASSGYTAKTAKRVFSNWYVAAKDHGFWSKLTEVYFFVGGTFAGLAAKGKYQSVPTLTNVGFVADDYTPDGANAGLYRTGNTKRFTTGFFSVAESFTPGDDAHITVAWKNASTTGAAVSDSSGSSLQSSVFARTGTTRLPGDFNLSSSPPTDSTIITGSRTSTVLLKQYWNGAYRAQRTQATSYTQRNTEFAIFRHPNAETELATFIGKFFSLGKGLSDEEAIALQEITNELMGAFGAGIY